MCDPAPATHPAILEALRLLGIKRLLVGIHDPAFPCRPEEDIGRGSPYTLGARDFLAFVRRLGFNGVQLGPQGMTSLVNPSPYDGTLFSRNRLSIAPGPLTTADWGNLLAAETLTDLVAECPSAGKRRVLHEYTCHVRERVLSQVWDKFQVETTAGKLTDLAHEFALFRKHNGGWLMRDGLYEALRHHYGGVYWRDWQGSTGARLDRELWHPGPGERTESAARRRALFARHREAIAAYAFAQFLLDRQHRGLRECARSLGLDLFGDLQIGFSGRDAWFAQSFLLEGYVMGAPPSRTNPEGQPWNYPVLDPARYFSTDGARPGPALRFLRQRLQKMFREFDGLRIDHPHGLVCPWVYRAGAADPIAAVQAGARLFASPDLPDHPELGRYAIPRPDQISRDRPRYADDWVRELDAEQVDRYAALFDVIMEAAKGNGRDARGIACEILSTQPHPIRLVIERHGLGRFRVTQKADLDNPADVYRSENAHPEDWIMLGNHDTPPIWLLAREWQATGAAGKQAAYLGWRLLPEDCDREAFAARLAADPGELVQAKAADLFAGPAENVMVFFTDFLGMEEIYNRPGTVGDHNWSLRIPGDFAADYERRAAANRAINIPKALALALRSRGREFAAIHRPLLDELDRLVSNPCHILSS